jgi:hypothetical protein
MHTSGFPSNDHEIAVSELRTITPDIAAAFSLCKRKAFLQLRGDCGEPTHEYVQLIESLAAKGLNIFLIFYERQASLLNMEAATRHR